MMLQAPHLLNPCFNRAGSRLKNVDVWAPRLHSLRMKKQPRRVTAMCPAPEGENPGFRVAKKRKVVEHVCLFQAKEGLSNEEEKNMLDYLYTSQYQMPGIVSISVGRILEQNREAYTHALYVRFQRKEDIVKFYENPFQMKILEEHITPYCHGQISVDFESEVEDDIIPIFRKGEEFNYGAEFVLLLAFSKGVPDEQAEDAMASFAIVVLEFPLLIVQSTQGRNFNVSSSAVFTDVIVIRFRSTETCEIFVGSTEYKTVSSHTSFFSSTFSGLLFHYCNN
uniref:Stress-response A/B barrel domain-containing protein n=1 Tax=Kalanchoe fedtschenkoi TaxID=63787 RepID=A0A7N0VJB6_KALFE